MGGCRSCVFFCCSEARRASSHVENVLYINNKSTIVLTWSSVRACCGFVSQLPVFGAGFFGVSCGFWRACCTVTTQPFCAPFPPTTPSFSFPPPPSPLFLNFCHHGRPCSYVSLHQACLDEARGAWSGRCCRRCSFSSALTPRRLIAGHADHRRYGCRLRLGFVRRWPLLDCLP